MIKGAPVTPEASTISGASATTEVQNNSAEVQNNSASASDPVDAEAPAKILIPLEHCLPLVPCTHFACFGHIYRNKFVLNTSRACTGKRKKVGKSS